MTHYNTTDDTVQHSAQTSGDTYTNTQSKFNVTNNCLIQHSHDIILVYRLTVQKLTEIPDTDPY